MLLVPWLALTTSRDGRGEEPAVRIASPTRSLDGELDRIQVGLERTGNRACPVRLNDGCGTGDSSESVVARGFNYFIVRRPNRSLQHLQVIGCEVVGVASHQDVEDGSHWREVDRACHIELVPPGETAEVEFHGFYRRRPPVNRSQSDDEKD